MIKLSQEWSATAWMPPRLHDWDQFITPAELGDALMRNNLRHHDMIGLAPGVAPPALFRMMRQLKKGMFSPAEFGRRASFVLKRDLRVSYIGHATKICP